MFKGWAGRVGCWRCFLGILGDEITGKYLLYRAYIGKSENSSTVSVIRKDIGSSIAADNPSRSWMHRRPPSPPQPPRRGRSRSRSVGDFPQRTREVLEANRRNLNQRRGGAAAQRRTRAIHKRLLVILINYLGDLLTGTQDLSDSYRQERRVRRVQAEERLEYLEQGNFPENKWEVLPGLRWGPTLGSGYIPAYPLRVGNS